MRAVDILSIESIVIDHSFFNDGALLFIVRGEMVFLYPCDDQFGVWFTGRDYVKENLSHFLNECSEDMHSTFGSGHVGTFKEMIDSIKE